MIIFRYLCILLANYSYCQNCRRSCLRHQLPVLFARSFRPDHAGLTPNDPSWINEHGTGCSGCIFERFFAEKGHPERSEPITECTLRVRSLSSHPHSTCCGGLIAYEPAESAVYGLGYLYRMPTPVAICIKLYPSQSRVDVHKYFLLIVW